jgi:hypothetical protein
LPDCGRLARPVPLINAIDAATGKQILRTNPTATQARALVRSSAIKNSRTPFQETEPEHRNQIGWWAGATP